MNRLPGMDPSRQRANILFALSVAAALFLAYKIRGVLLIIYVSILFAVVINPAVQRIQRIQRLHVGDWHPQRSTAIVIIFLLVISFLGLFLLSVLPSVVEDAQELTVDWPRKAATLYERLQHLPLVDRVSLASLEQHLSAAIGGIVGILRTLATSFASLLTCLVLTLYFVLDGSRAFSWVMSMFHPDTRQRLEPTIMRAEQLLRRWLLGQGALMLVLGISSALVFRALRIKYFYALAVVAGLANIVPILGPMISLILTSVVAAFDSWTKLIGVLIFYLLYQQVENVFLTPRIMKATLNLPPLAVVVALSVGGAVAGIVGALVAVPTAALVQVFATEYLVKQPHTNDTARSFRIPT
jgi:predicted PurR-regulated permease PerM